MEIDRTWKMIVISVSAIVGVRSRRRRIGSSMQISTVPICDSGIRWPAVPTNVKSAFCSDRAARCRRNGLECSFDHQPNASMGLQPDDDGPRRRFDQRSLAPVDLERLRKDELHHQNGLVAKINGEGAGAATVLTSLNPAAVSQFLYSANVNVSPCAVRTSMCSAKINGITGPLRSSSGTNSAIRTCPPARSARNPRSMSRRVASAPSP
jgi:hypothetical protein